MSAQKCQKCGVRVFFYRDEFTGAEKCPSCGTTNPHTPEEEDSPVKCPSSGSELFWSMGGFMLKLSKYVVYACIAAIPAGIIVGIWLLACSYMGEHDKHHF
jgi:ribosomal protein S27E